MPTTRIRNQFSFSQAWCPQQELEINSLSLRPDAHNAFGAGGRLQQLEEDFFRLAGKKTWDSQFVWPIQHAIELYVSYEEENMCSEVYLMLQKRELKEERFVSLSTTVAESSSNLSLNRCHTQSTFFTIGSFEITETRDIPMARYGEHNSGI